MLDLLKLKLIHQIVQIVILFLRMFFNISNLVYEIFVLIQERGLTVIDRHDCRYF